MRYSLVCNANLKHIRKSLSSKFYNQPLDFLVDNIHVIGFNRITYQLFQPYSFMHIIV